jgi:iron complex transport system permease protein
MTEARTHVLTLAGLSILLGIALVLAILVGSVTIPLLPALTTMLSALHLGSWGRSLPPTSETILVTVRLPRVLLAALVGGGLAVVGAALQAVFRNPMADSGLLGVGSGAAFGAVLAVRLGWANRVFLALPAAAFLGALAAILLVYALSHVRGRPSLHGLLLTGLAVSAVGSAGTSLLLVATEDFQVKTVLFWLAGGLEGRSWSHLEFAGGLIVLGVSLLCLLGRLLDVLSLGEEEAASLGLPVHGARILVLALSALVAGAATAASGSVAFVGLMAPHALRPLVGPLGRHLLPAAFLGGAILVVLADLVSRIAMARFDLPLGALTALVGAPYFLLALKGQEGRA